MTDADATTDAPEAIKPKGKPKPAPAKIGPVRFANLTVNDTLQPRAGKLNEDHVADLAEAYKAGRAVPPVVVYRTAAGELILSQGFHRVAAVRRSGAAFITAEIRSGERFDATLDALSSNQDHGLKRTTADKRRATTQMLALCPKWSDRRIADQLGVDSGTVAAVREEFAKTDATAAPTEREGKNGQKVTVKPKAKPSPKAEPKADAPGPEPTASAPLERTSAPADDGATKANTDALGLRIPDAQMMAFEARGEFEQLIATLKHAKSLVTTLGHHVGGSLLLKRLQWIRSDNAMGGRWSLGDLDNALIAVEDAVPQIADCPYRYAEGEHDLSCGLCHGAGFVGDLRHRQVPAELVAKMTAARTPADEAA